MSAHSLSDLSSRLREQVGLPAVFNCINTRLIIQTGINLKKIDASQDTNPELLRRVMGALIRMGIQLEAK